MFRQTLAICLALAPLSAAAQEGEMSWQTYSYQPSEPGDVGLSAVYGLPESDFALVSAQCRLGETGPVIVADMETDVSGQTTEGTPVLVEFEGLGGGLPVVSGRIQGLGAEIGIQGVRIEAPVDDRLWAHIAAADPIRYRLRATPPRGWMQIPGDPGTTLSDFVAQCAAAGAAPAEPAPATDTVATDAGCDRLAEARSIEGGNAREVLVVNNSGSDRGVVWIDENGDEVSMGTLPAGATGTLDTKTGHVWMFTDETGDCAAVFETGLTDQFVLAPATAAPAEPAPARVDTK
ncbi:hypothetical protein HKCCE3408_07120 [Rhodobacterales bacterium HKCCE3408]|nr:hypothetical protein [Rhodobacterales bacterium HKCCE3408]